MAKHHPDLVFCRKQSGIAIGRLCDKCDGKCVICDSYVRPHILGKSKNHTLLTFCFEYNTFFSIALLINITLPILLQYIYVMSVTMVHSKVGVLSVDRRVFLMLIIAKNVLCKRKM